MSTTAKPEEKKTQGPQSGAPRKNFKSMMDGAVQELKPYLPSEELIGGSIPYLPGFEDEGVWNAAAQSCGTERIHYLSLIHI